MTSLPKPPPKPVDWVKRLKDRAYDPNYTIEKVRGIYTFNGIIVSTPGNLTTLYGLPKAGKSAVVGAMIASSMAVEGSEGNCLTWWSENPERKPVLHFCSEHSRDDYHFFIRRILARAGRTECPGWFYTYQLLGLSAKETLDFIKHAVEEVAKNSTKFHSIFTDGPADAVENSNDIEQSNQYTSWANTVAGIYDCPMIGVLHLNPSGDKGRGHLGSQLERKSESNLIIDKDKDDGDLSFTHATKQRRAPINRDTCPCFQWSNDAEMHIQVENPTELKKQENAKAQNDGDRVYARSLFEKLGKSALNTGEIIKDIVSTQGCDGKTGQRTIKRWLSNGLITKQSHGIYALIT